MPRQPNQHMPGPSTARLAVAGILVALAGSQASAAAQPTPDAKTTRCDEPVSALYQRVSSAVVSIAALSIDPYDPDHRMDRVTGSGIIIDPAGLVLTNSHVVFGRQAITVTLDEGVTVPANLVGADPLFDLAVLRIPPPQAGELAAARMGDSDKVLVGDEVFVIGSPLGLEQTLTRGIVSAVNRLLPGASWSLTEPMIQTDAAINPGNSGGPLIDRCGQVIGVTTALLPEGRSIGFAVPSNLVKAVVPVLLEHGRIIRPWLGVQGQLVVPQLKELLRVPLADGFLVEVVEPGSPAEQAGVRGGQFELAISGQPLLLGGDIITAVNGDAVDDPEKLGRALGGLEVGATAHLTVLREDTTLQFDVVLGERPLLPWDISAQRSVAPAVASATARPFGRGRSTRRAF